MGMIKSQKPLIQADTEPFSIAISGWISGWTFSAPTEALNHETTIPIGLSCCRLPGQFVIDIPGLKEAWILPVSPQAECRLSAHGVRLIEEGDEQDAIVSVCLHDASTMLVEADEALLLRSIDPESLITEADVTHTVNAGKHRIVFFLQRNRSPSRLIVVSGAGEAQGLLAKARSFTNLSAHQQLDHTLSANTRDGTDPSYAVMPAEYVRSRFRPASATLPFPWLADDEDEPVWRLERLYPVYRALLLTDPVLAAGLVGNLIEMIDSNGNLPIAGGNASPIYHGPVYCPLLIGMIMDYVHQTGEWPFERSSHTGKLQTYMHGLLNNQQVRSTDEVIEAEIWSMAWPREASQWLALIRESGMTSNLGIPSTTWDDRPDRPMSPSLLAMLDHRIPAIERKKMASELLTQIGEDTGLLDHEIARERMIDIVEEVAQLDRDAADHWITIVRRQFGLAWKDAMGNLAGGPRLTGADPLVLAGVCSWIEHWKTSDPEQKYRIAGWLNRHRKTMLAATGVMISLLITFLFAVQLRSTMPSTVYETRLGMAMQDYQTATYDAAIEKLNDIAASGHQRNPLNLFLLGKVYYRNKQYDKAAEVFQRVVEVNASNPSAHFNLGLSLFKAGRPTEAKEVFVAMSEVFARTHPVSAARAARAAVIVDRYEKTGQ
jgi:hypothetical protein